MLRKMYLENFLSFKERTEVDFSASKYTILSKTNVNKSGVLKGAFFIGPNASGKTNVLKGIAFLIDMIKGEGVNILGYRCHFSPNPVIQTTYEFCIDELIYVYSIEYNVFEHNMHEVLRIDDEVVLKRNGGEGEIIIGGQSVSDNQLDSSTLFLRTASFNTGRFPQAPNLRKFMSFLMNSFYVDGFCREAFVGKNIYNYVVEYGADKINEYLDMLNYGFRIEYGTESEGEGVKLKLDQDRKEIILKRLSFPVPSRFKDESQGNKILSDMLPLIINVIENPGMIVIDEFGNSLHNKLAERLVRFFMEKTSDSQIFITSHHTNLVSNSVFRPDQIQIVDFKSVSGSYIDRISNYKPREAQNLEKMYLGGMFEGLPIYEKIQDR